LLDEERAKVTRRIKELQDEVRQLDNNLGFFANSKGAEKIIADVHKKMDNFKDEIKGLEAKLNLMYE
jgi:archaellum component FlaC